jgi:pyruvate dehydrogenase E1 component alpha subunit
MALPDADTAHALLRHMLRIRAFEDACAEQYSATRIRGFLHLYNGEEAIAAGIIPLLDAADAIVATYREHGHALVRGVDMGAVMAEMFGKQEGCSHGRGGSMHLFDAAARLYGGNAIVAGGLPLAVGLALAERMQGGSRIVACFFGEGAMAEGAFAESPNLAALWQLPVLFCCENNLYAMGTALARSQAQTDLCAKAAAFNVAAQAVDGMDVLAVHAATRDAVARVRGGAGPAFVEYQPYSVRAHSMFDPELYRDKAEVAKWKERGPIHSFSARLKACGLLDEAGFLALQAQAEAEVEAAVAFAEAAPLESPASLLADLYTPQVAP